MKGPYVSNQPTPARRRCSFCGASAHQVGRLQAGMGSAAICDACVVRLFATLDREAFSVTAPPVTGDAVVVGLRGGSDDA
ncbi:ClpX C4-type zinc finger [Myxococcus fulvus]|uniref:ClpX C4-type zinc finger n=1 Tax=Myxococcus fulvus TaxID=33 RepID=A0A511SYT1_MYXFU|nr:ClpX C4-type zinc finger protein [Myxococcus fulvus]GEN07029.1 hypothetical protein MFU01_20660 [Myxococcus fulvus]SEU01188.1 ClpX C4-type zinc finger [Myxococcus fulvus]